MTRRPQMGGFSHERRQRIDRSRSWPAVRGRPFEGRVFREAGAGRRSDDRCAWQRFCDGRARFDRSLHRRRKAAHQIGSPMSDFEQSRTEIDTEENVMTASLTLNKITAQRGISIGEAANRVADLGWTPSYVQEAMTFPTDYKIYRVPRDPMKQVLRSYFPMQEEKDNRVYGALDAALRGDMFRNVEPRWIEWMKLFLAIIPFPEISAARSMAMVGRLSPGEELRTGFTMQMVDELRHSTIQMNLKKWYMENYIDPAGFDITEAAFGRCYASTIGRQFAEGFLTGDAITAASIYLTVVAETAFTNTLFVAMPSEAARNGDYALPTVFLS